MSKSLITKQESLHNNENIPNFDEITPFDLRLVSKKIKIKYSVYKISTLMKNMYKSESLAISHKGILFSSEAFYEKGTLLRVWVEVPEYWSRKAKHVDYHYTEAPTHFQVLTRVISCEDQLSQYNKFHILCENLNIDSVDESVLQDYLVSSAGANFK